MFSPGSFPPDPKATPDTLRLIYGAEVDLETAVLTYTLEQFFDEAAEYLHVSASNSESTRSQLDWEKTYALEVLGHQEGVAMYPLPHKARTLLSSPHFRLKKGYDALPVGDSDIGLRIFNHAKQGFGPFRQVATLYDRGDLLNKIDVPEPGMALVYFGADTIGRNLVSGLKEALFHRNGRGFGNAFWKAMDNFEDKFRKPMERATLNQIEKVMRDPDLKGNVEFQISAPATHGLASLLALGNFMSKRLVSDSFYKDGVQYLVGTVASLLRNMPEGAPRVTHNCKGELDPVKFMGAVFHPSEKHAWSNEAAVAYEQEIVRQTEAVNAQPRQSHVAMTPARALTVGKKEALKILAPFEAWPKGVRLAAGIITHDTTVEEGFIASQNIQQVLGTETVFDIGWPCGAGRWRSEIAGKGWDGVALSSLKTMCAILQRRRNL